MDIRQLKYFVEVAREKSYTKAANKLFVSQPALSKMIKNLENELGAQLFNRQGKNVVLTDCGENLYEKAQKTISYFDGIQESLKDIKELKKGQITVGIPPVIGSLYFAPIISSFKRNYPGINFIMFEEGARTVYTKVIEGVIDVGIVISPVNSRELVSIPVMEDECVVVVNKMNPLSNKQHISFIDLKNEPFNSLNEHFLLYEQIISKCHEAGFEPDITFKSSQWDFIIEMVSLNQGIAILPRPIVARSDFPDIRILSLRPSFRWEITIIIKKEKYITYLMKEFINHVKKSFEGQKNI